jgi:hypothetical protein
MATINIERLDPRNGVAEVPYKTRRGYKLADPGYGREMHHAKNAIYRSTIQEAADLVEAGHWIWMTQPGKRPSLISPASLRITRT